MQKYNKNSAGEQSVKEFFLFDSDDLFFVKAFSVDYSGHDKFLSNYFAMLEFVITFVKNRSSGTLLAAFKGENYLHNQKKVYYDV